MYQSGEADGRQMGSKELLFYFSGFFCFLFFFIFIFKLYNIVLVLPNIKMNLRWAEGIWVPASLAGRGCLLVAKTAFVTIAV